jgi:hypothetical protein
MRKSLSLLTVAGTAALLQAATILGAFAWLSRRLPVESVGRFGLYLAVVSFVLGLDGLRPAVVVATVASGGRKDIRSRSLAGMALGIGALAGLGIMVVGRPLLGFAWTETLPLALTALLTFAVSPGLGFLEGSRGPQFAAATQSVAWSAAIAVAASLAVSDHDVTSAVWALVLGPCTIAVALGATGQLVSPSFAPDSTVRKVAYDGMRSHIVTAISGFADKGIVATRAGSAQLGLYTPLAELTSRAAALSGLVANLFLRDETLTAYDARPDQQETAPHHSAVDAFFAIACTAISVAALMADPLLEMFLGRTGAEQALTFRLLMAALILNIGAQWSAVALRARGEFDLYRPYVASLLLAIIVAPLLVPALGMPGAACIVLVLRSADVALLYRARRRMTRIQLGAMLTGMIIVLSVAAIVRLRQ